MGREGTVTQHVVVVKLRKEVVSLTVQQKEKDIFCDVCDKMLGENLVQRKMGSFVRVSFRGVGAGGGALPPLGFGLPPLDMLRILLYM